MANSWNGPQLGSPIRTDVPELQKKLIALLKQDPTSVANIPSGAKRLVNTSGVQWQVQQYNGSSWAAIGKLMHDVDKLDGYHAAITPAANTVAVRNADKKLEGDITGSAATASSAATLSQTLPVNKGGTGATTSAAARTNLGVPPTSHASSSTTYGLATDSSYGHVRSDGDTTNIVAGEVVVKDVAIGGDSADLASRRGQIGDNIRLPENTDLNTVLTVGFYGVRGITTISCPTNSWSRLQVINGYFADESHRTQILTTVGDPDNISEYVRAYRKGTWSEWVKMVNTTNLATSSTPGIVKPGTGMSVDSTGSLGVNDTVVRTSGNQTISGQKCSTTRMGWPILQNAVERGNSETNNDGGTYCTYDKNKKLIGVLDFWVRKGESSSSLYVLNAMDANDSSSKARISVYFRKDGVKYDTCPTPPPTSNANSIATTEWVRSYTIPTGTLIPSLAASMTGYLLCNGAAVSRTTYADLFSIIGTKFGAGDGSETFNLPDFRNRVFWGANGNLMSILSAGLPNFSGAFWAYTVGWSDASGTGPFYNMGAAGTPGNRGGEGGNACTWGFDPARVSSVYGKSSTVQPPAIAVNIFIKY